MDQSRLLTLKISKIPKKATHCDIVKQSKLSKRGMLFNFFYLIIFSLLFACNGKLESSAAFLKEDGTPVDQRIPGKIQLELYDLGGEGKSYHDFDSANRGSGGLNKGSDYFSRFRIEESVDISYSKHRDSIDNSKYNLVAQGVNQLYVGWTEPGEWLNYTINVSETGKYQVGLMFTSRYDGKVRISTEANDAFVDLSVPSTYDAEDPIDWRQWHHWNYLDDLGTIELKKGTQVIRLTTLEKGEMNYDYLNFQLKNH